MDRKPWVPIVIIGVLIVAAIFVLKTQLSKPSSSSGVPTPTGASADSSTQAQASVPGFYRANLASADTAGRVITLTLNMDQTAVFSQDYQNDEAPIVQNGTWSQSGGMVELKLQDGTVSEIIKFGFTEINGGVLTLIDPEQAGWGTDGLVLQNITPLTGKKWVWTQTQMSDGATTQTNAEKSFSLTFSNEGNVQMTTDCNNGNGGYKLTGDNGITIGPMATTMMFCEGSQENVFNQQLGNVDSYHMQDGNLHLLIKMDSGTMTFTPGQ